MRSSGLNSAGTENTVRKGVSPAHQGNHTAFGVAKEFSGHPIAQRTVLIKFRYEAGRRCLVTESSCRLSATEGDNQCPDNTRIKSTW